MIGGWVADAKGDATLSWSVWGEKVCAAGGEGGRCDMIVRGASTHFDVDIEKTAERHLECGKG